MIELELKQIAEKKSAQIIKKELDTKKYEEVAWLKAFKKAHGDKVKAELYYVEIREVDLFKEIYASLENNLNEKVKKEREKVEELQKLYDSGDAMGPEKAAQLIKEAKEKREKRKK
jgi:regulator of PEP synthase PpsR (kinase-PPPase family)